MMNNIIAIDKRNTAATNKFKAIKFGLQTFGLDIQLDEQHLIAAREGIRKDLDLMIDVGAIWGTNID